jgi:hypothetical protein
MEPQEVILYFLPSPLLVAVMGLKEAQPHRAEAAVLVVVVQA